MSRRACVPPGRWGPGSAACAYAHAMDKVEGGTAQSAGFRAGCRGTRAAVDAATSHAAGQPLFVAASALDEDPSNPRTELPEDELTELTEDIRQRGILQPIVAHPPDAAGRYRIHFGARRWRAAQLAGFDRVPIVVRDAPADPYAQVAENQKRHGLTPLDLARFMRGRIDAGSGRPGSASAFLHSRPTDRGRRIACTRESAR